MTIHRIQDDTGSLKNLRRDLEYLKRHFDIVTPSSLNGTLKENSAIITVDDCYEDIYTHLYGIVKELDVPITICVPTDFFFREKWLWMDAFYWALEQIEKGVKLKIGRLQIEKGKTPWKRIVSHLKKMEPASRKKDFDRLLENNNLILPEKPTKEFRPVTIPQMREMLSSGLIELCSHSASHLIMSKLCRIL